MEEITRQHGKEALPNGYSFESKWTILVANGFRLIMESKDN